MISKYVISYEEYGRVCFVYSGTEGISECSAFMNISGKRTLFRRISGKHFAPTEQSILRISQVNRQSRTTIIVLLFLFYELYFSY